MVLGSHWVARSRRQLVCTEPVWSFDRVASGGAAERRMIEFNTLPPSEKTSPRDHIKLAKLILAATAVETVVAVALV